MRKSLLLGMAVLLLVACEHQYAQNPDPNHTHADFAVWIEGEQIDFSGNEYMSGLSTDESTHDEADERHHEYLHLHDNNGHVIHSHKPGQTLGEFFESLGFVFSKDGLNLCAEVPGKEGRRRVCEDEAMHRNWIMIVNGVQKPFFDTAYAFSDMDKILIVLPKTDDGDEHPEAWGYWEKMTDDACLYSKTCPWRGDPPTENCIADPAVPCVVPPEDL